MHGLHGTDIAVLGVYLVGVWSGLVEMANRAR